MNEIVINDVAYPVRFGLGFLREINKREITDVPNMPGVKREVGFQYTLAKILDGDVEALVDVIYLANKTENPRITMSALEAWIEDDNTDIDEAFETVLGFLRKANATRKETIALEKAIQEA